MSGTWAMRRGVGFLPLQFALSQMGSQHTHTSAGALSKALLTPNGPVTGGGAVNATGSGPATLAPNGGPGSFTWCPGDPACVDLPGTLDRPGRGRIVYRAGANRFGGVMQMLLQGRGSVSIAWQYSPFQALHVHRTPTSTLDSGIQHTGGPYATVVRDYLPRGFVTQPLVAPTANGLITAPGPKLTTMFASPADRLSPTRPSFFLPS